jgi:hypothetical protein
VWWRKPYEGLDGHGRSPNGRCEGSPESSEASSLGKLRVFSKPLIGTIGTSSITAFGMVLPLREAKFLILGGKREGLFPPSFYFDLSRLLCSY